MRIAWLMIDIALLRRGPQDLPASLGFTLAALAAYAGSGVLVQLQIAPEMPPLPPVLFELGLTVALAGLVLWYRDVLGRLPQTLSALAGTGTLLTLCGLPVIRLLQAGDPGGVLSMGGVILWLGLVCWSLLVSAHILRHALSVSLNIGLLLAMVFLVLSALLYGTLFGGAQ